MNVESSVHHKLNTTRGEMLEILSTYSHLYTLQVKLGEPKSKINLTIVAKNEFAINLRNKFNNKDYEPEIIRINAHMDVEMEIRKIQKRLVKIDTVWTFPRPTYGIKYMRRICT